MNWLEDIRKNNVKTETAVAKLCGITPQYYNYIENGKRRPSVQVAKRIADVLGFEWTKFFESD